MLLTAFVLSCGGGSQGESAPAPTPTSPAPASVGRVVGVTTDDPTVGTADQVDALAALPRRAMVRTTFDLGRSPSDYVASISAISRVADVMGQPLDSSDMSRLGPAGVRARIDQYIAALGDTVSVWEVGNEVNGNWVGPDPMAKVEAMFDAAKSAGRRTALTLYYENPPTPGFAMIPWVDEHIPEGHRMRSGLDYVLVSYYDDQNAGHQLTQPEMDAIFTALARRFPNARLGLGEFGWGKSIPTADVERAALIRRFYGYRVPSVPSYIGGGFYWHFRQTMAPRSRPDWTVLNEAFQSLP